MLLVGGGYDRVDADSGVRAAKTYTHAVDSDEGLTPDWATIGVDATGGGERWVDSGSHFWR